MVRLDVWGPYKKPTFDGNRFFLIVVDDYSRMTWLFLLKNKSDVCVTLSYFLQFVKTRFGKIVKKVSLDNGTEFVNYVCDNLLKGTGAYSPQQNRVAERKHRHVLEVTRAVRFQGKIPLIYLWQCVLATTK